MSGVWEIATGVLIVLSFVVVNIVDRPVIGYLILIPCLGTLALAAREMSRERTLRIAATGGVMGAAVLLVKGSKAYLFVLTVCLFGLTPWIVNAFMTRRKVG